MTILMTQTGNALETEAEQLLGPKVSHHPVGSGIFWVSVAVLGVLTFSMFIASIVYAIKNAWKTSGGFLAVVLIGFVGLWIFLRRLKWYIALHEKGILIKKSQTFIIPWKNIRFYKEKRSQAGRTTDHQFEIRTLEDQNISFDASFKDMETISETLDREITSQVVGNAPGIWAEKKSVDFGKLQMTSEGLEFNNDFLAWSEIDKIEVAPAGNQLALQVIRNGTQKPWYSRPIPEMPNFRAFMTLAKQKTTVIDES